jgi:malonyl CoA-acyl carrier protein transacylase
MNILYVFPGQGSQYEGMGKDIYEAHDNTMPRVTYWGSTLSICRSTTRATNST